MNQKIPFLTRQIVYSFLIGLIVGGAFIAFFDAYAKKPLFSSAYIRPGTTIGGVNGCMEGETNCVPGEITCVAQGGTWIDHKCTGVSN